ncbi:MAG: hypothetical protein LH461_00235 [Spirochaetaceae bacterium]|nr:hypothetical protein [Spirochaetaceae bacterium]
MGSPTGSAHNQAESGHAPLVRQEHHVADVLVMEVNAMDADAHRLRTSGWMEA